MIIKNAITSPRFDQDQHNAPMLREHIVRAKVTGCYLLIRGVRVLLIQATGICFQLLLGYGKTIVSESRQRMN
jgi:O-antigen ligase